MKNFLFITTLLCLISGSIGSQENRTDILEKVLNEVGFSRSDLGYNPKGYWNRFPLDVPYRLPAFDDLFAEPLKLYDFSRVMGNVTEKYLNPAYADSADNALYQLVYHLGVDKRQSGFRSYSANLALSPKTDLPLLSAIDRLYNMAGQELEYRTFGNKYGVIGNSEDISSQIVELPDTVQVIVAELLAGLADALHWHKLAFRNCKISDMLAALTIRDLSSTQADGQKYYPCLDDIASSIDQPSLHYAALKVAASAERAERKLISIVNDIKQEFSIELPTPFGKVAIFSPTYQPEKLPKKFLSSITAGRPEWFKYDASGTLAVIDLGRNSIWQGSPGAAITLENPISVLIDLGGDDYYGYEKENYPPSAGVGLLGVGIVIDSKGDDHYNGSIYAQGTGLFGVGVLFDREGDDNYRASESAQGAGYFGIGLCFDSKGDDNYYIHGDGQGLGSVGGGVGVLADYSGNDKYIAEPYAEVFNRGDYHSDNLINGNSAQGAGFGRRGDGSDGHSWAGGLGALIDIYGDDAYYSGNFTMGVGYWFGTGILFDKSGDDHYKSCYFTQGSGAHYCNGILIDEAGNDYHELFETAGAAFAFGWDYTNAILINKGGDDKYSAKMISYGLAEIRSNAIMVDIGGNDEYLFSKDGRGFGGATYRSDFGKPSAMTPYYYYSKSFGTFIDIGGKDSYYTIDGDKREAHPLAGENKSWLQPSKTDSTYGANNYGIGIDIDSGIVPDFILWDE